MLTFRNNLEKLDLIYFRTAADVLSSASLNNDEFGLIKSTSDAIISLQLNELLSISVPYENSKEEACNIKLTRKQAVDSFIMICNKVEKILMILDKCDTTSLDKTDIVSPDSQNYLNISLCLKVLSCFNYLYLYITNIEIDQFQNSNVSNNYTTSHAVGLTLMQMGHIFNFCSTLYINFQPKFKEYASGSYAYNSSILA